MNRVCALFLALVFVLAAPLNTMARGSHGGSHRSYRGSTFRLPRTRTYKPREFSPRVHSRSYLPRASPQRYRSSSPYVRRIRQGRLPRARTHRNAGLTRWKFSPPASSGGKIVRSRDAKAAFERETGHPHGWPGHVVDHINPLACGGADSPSNMQWQTIAEGKAKDKWERKGCPHGHR